jgi:hypothetical protein
VHFTVSTLTLIRRARVADLVGVEERREASGVVVRDGLLLVACDNTDSVAVLDPGLALPGPHREIRLRGGRGRGYEDIAADPATRRLFIVVETLPKGPPYHALVEEYDDHYRLVAAKILDIPLAEANKGIEGLAVVRHDGRTHLLGLPETGRGRLPVFTEAEDRWKRIATIRLPLSFDDYAGVAVTGGRIAVISQESSALWLGHLDPRTWTVDEGVVHEFPRDRDGRPRYTAVEGVAFLGPDQIVVATDRTRGVGHNSTEQSVAVFALPTVRTRARPPRPAPVVRGLFPLPVDGDDALLRLAQLRFAQLGMPAEFYAHSPAALESVLRFAPDLPIVHLDRAIDVRTAAGQAAVDEFTARFAGRVAGFVVHDQAGMAADVPQVVAALRGLGRSGLPTVYLEYAAGMDPELFLEIGEGLRAADGVGLCIDVGHVGIQRARARFAALHPDLPPLSLSDPRLPDLADAVQECVAAALPAVVDLIRAAGALGRTVHHHLHDGHPLLPGTPDHRSFLFRPAIPFPHRGRFSLDPLYGPDGLAALLRAATETTAPDGPSLTLEIHKADGRRPLDDAADLFAHWRDRTNAERVNHVLAVVAGDHMLATSALAGRD